MHNQGFILLSPSSLIDKRGIQDKPETRRGASGTATLAQNAVRDHGLAGNTLNLKLY